MAIVHAHIYYPNNVDSTGNSVVQAVSAYDLRKVISWSDATTRGITAMVAVRIQDCQTPLEWPKVQFEAAKTASLGAANG